MQQNPDKVRMSQIWTALEYNERCLYDLMEEKCSIERQIEVLQNEMQALHEGRFVLVDQNESFEDHLNCVEYTMGYYETIEAALLDVGEFPSGWAIYNLNGVKVRSSETVVSL